MATVSATCGSWSWALIRMTRPARRRTWITTPFPDAGDDDMDGDGYPNRADVFPRDAAEWADLDADGTGDNADRDIDGDGISNPYEQRLNTDPRNAASVPPDLDGDGIPDALDDDRDGDGYRNPQDRFADDASEWADLDNDGVGDNRDPDRDGDGFQQSE